MAKYATMPLLKSAVEAAGNILTVSMRDLREMYDSSRLGANVVTRIANDLRRHGLSHVPEELPNEQSQPVRLYLQATPVADLINAALTPGPAQDKKLLASVAGADPQALADAALLRKVRAVLA
jgi:hypothetical protein